MSDANEVARDFLVSPEVGRGPGVLIVHSGRGLTDFPKKLAGRIAREGFVAYVPDMFEGETPHSVAEARSAKNAVSIDDLLRKLEDAAVFLRSNRDVSRDHIGILGIGYGAEIACKLAPELQDKCNALVLFYGYQDTNWGDTSASVLGHYAQLDQEYPESKVDDIRQKLRTQEIDHDLFIYSNAEPSFFETDDTARHNPEAAKLAWERTIHFLRSRFMK